MEIDKEFIEILTYDIAPIIKECTKSKHRLNNIKIHETLHSLKENNKIDTYNINYNGLYLYISSKKYITPAEFSRIFIEIQKPDHRYSNFLEESR